MRIQMNMNDNTSNEKLSFCRFRAIKLIVQHSIWQYKSENCQILSFCYWQYYHLAFKHDSTRWHYHVATSHYHFVHPYKQNDTVFLTALSFWHTIILCFIFLHAKWYNIEYYTSNKVLSFLAFDSVSLIEYDSTRHMNTCLPSRRIYDVLKWYYARNGMRHYHECESKHQSNRATITNTTQQCCHV